MHFSSHHSQIVGISIKRLMAFWKCSNTSNFLAFSHQTYFTMTAFYSELWPQQAPLQLETETFSFLFFSFSFEILHFNEDLRCSNRIIWCVFVRPIIIISHHMHSHKLNDREGEIESACVRSAINSLKCACAFSIKHEISIPSHQNACTLMKAKFPVNFGCNEFQTPTYQIHTSAASRMIMRHKFYSISFAFHIFRIRKFYLQHSNWLSERAKDISVNCEMYLIRVSFFYS